ncbi:arylsulfatase [Thalassoglobus sp. JC818]|uniref:arylsulfatase n=1 Tax=Thalassoglobus sp. JC818 TaxID=3232136 RepID=UPI003459F28C
MLAANTSDFHRQKLCRMIAFWAACLWLATASAADPVATEEKPNILLIVADDLGFSDLGCYGGEIETPELDRLASNGTRLTRFYTTGRCCPSRASLLTGQYPHRVGVGHKVEDLRRPGYRGRIPEGTPTIADVLQAGGYRCFHSGKWHLGTPDPTEHGFEEFYGTLISAQTFWDPDHYLRLPAGRERIEYPEGRFYGTDAVTDHALQFLEMSQATPGSPWFLYVAYHAPHFPLHAREEDIAKYADTYSVGWDQIREDRLTRMKELGIVDQDTNLTPRSQYWNFGETHTGLNPEWGTLSSERRLDLARRMAIYAAMVDRVDQNIGRIVDALQATEQFEDTLIIFLSDNGACAEWDPYGFDGKSSPNNELHVGEQLDEMGGPETYHSVGSGWANASNSPWRLYKHFNHEGGISSPCIVHWPNGSVPRNVVSHQPAHLIDVMPTAAEVADTELADNQKGPGENLISLLNSEDDRGRILFFEHEGNRAVHAGDWKLVSLRDEPWELYHIPTDRTELVNLADHHSELVEDLERKWNEWAAENFVTPLPDDYEVKYLRRPGQQPPQLSSE